jgi:outer membrane protein
MMARRNAVPFLAAAAVALAVPVAAQTAPAAPGALRLAVIDVQRILVESAPGKEAMTRLKGLQDQKLAEAKTKQDEISQLRGRISEGRLSLAEDKLAELEKQAEDKMIAFRRFQDDADRELQKARDEAFGSIEKRVLPIINQVGGEGGYTLIFNKFQSGLIFADDKVDITNQVIERFNSGAASQGK